MQHLLPNALQAVIDECAHLPGVGPRTAARYAYALLKASPSRAKKLGDVLHLLHASVKVCPRTFALINADETISPLYTDTARDKRVIAVVEDPLDVIAIEKTGQFNGTYHVLGGVISPIDDVGPEQLHINELVTRIGEDDVQEVILATNASVEGETTAMYLQRQINEAGVRVTLSRLARGLPVGVDLEYADHITLKHALEGRRNL